MAMKNKIFVVATTSGFLGFFKGQLKFLNKHFEVQTVSSYGERLNDIRTSEGVTTHSIPIKREIALFSDIVSLYKLVKLFITEKPKIVHGNTPKGSLLSMMAAYLTRVPIRIYFCHGLRYQGYKPGTIIRRLLQFTERVTCRLATNVFCVSDGIKEVMINDGISTKPKVILNGSINGLNFNDFKKDDDMDPQRLKEAVGIPKDNFIFLFVGRIVRDKGINELVTAFDKLSLKYRNISLLLIGSFEKNNTINTTTLKHIKESKSIYSTGLVNDVKPYMQIASCLTLPSYREGLPTVLLEAAAMDLPVIASDIPGCNNVVEKDINGIFVKPRDPQNLYEQMEKMLLNSDLRDYIINNTRESAIKRFDQLAVWNAMLNEYRKLEQEHV